MRKRSDIPYTPIMTCNGDEVATPTETGDVNSELEALRKSLRAAETRFYANKMKLQGQLAQTEQQLDAAMRANDRLKTPLEDLQHIMKLEMNEMKIKHEREKQDMAERLHAAEKEVCYLTTLKLGSGAAHVYAKVSVLIFFFFYNFLCFISSPHTASHFNLINFFLFHTTLRHPFSLVHIRFLLLQHEDRHALKAPHAVSLLEERLSFHGMGADAAQESYERRLSTFNKVRPSSPAQLASSVQILTGHEGGVLAVAMSDDGTRAASGSLDGTVNLWDVATGKLIRTMQGHKNWVVAVGFSREGDQIVSGSNDKNVHVWSAATGERECSMVGHENWVTSVAFSPNDEHVVSGCLDSKVRIWDAAVGVLVHVCIGHKSDVTSVAYSTDGHFIVSASHDKTAKIWDSKHGTCVQTFSGKMLFCSFLLFSDSRHLTRTLETHQ